MSKITVLVIILLSILFASCSITNYKTSYKANDFTKAKLFTNGIEGPAVDSKGNLYAVNFKKEGTIGLIDSKGNCSTFITLPNGSKGNGIRFDINDNMYIADYTNHNVLTILAGTSQVQILAHDSTMNQPNDLAIAPDGTLYASDPNWSESTGNIWMVMDDKFVLLESDMGTTNGIEVSPDGKKLYVNESVQRNIWVYDIIDNGMVKNKKLFKAFEDFGMDGMRCDEKGNLYVCRYGKGTVVILSPEGNMLREITLKGKNPTNITFGGKNNKQCFVTIQERGCFETFFID